MNKSGTSSTTEVIQASLKKRYAREQRFRWYGRAAVFSGFVFLAILLTDIVVKGSPAFTQQYLQRTVEFDPQRLDIAHNPGENDLQRADYSGLIKSSLRSMFPEVSGRKEKRALYRLLSIGAEYDLRDQLLDNPELLGQTLDIWLLAHSEAAAYLKGQISPDSPESDRKLKDNQVAWLDYLREEGRTQSRFNSLFLAG